jgi:hypothetical protein
MPHKPTKPDRTFAAKYLRRESTRLRETAQRHRQTAASDTRPGVPEFFDKLAGRMETHAARFERVAGWMVDV